MTSRCGYTTKQQSKRNSLSPVISVAVYCILAEESNATKYGSLLTAAFPQLITQVRTKLTEV